MKRHSTDEITAMVRRAEELMGRGQSQAQACKALGVSVMTFHRWRKLELARSTQHAEAPIHHEEEATAGPDREDADVSRFDELRLENDRLRRIVTDLLLEKMKIEEKLQFKAPGKPQRRGSAQD